MNHGRQRSCHHLLNDESQLISVPKEVLRGLRRLKVLWEPASILRLASTTLLAAPSCSHCFITGSQSCLFSTSPLLLRVPWTAKRSNQSILKEINPEHSLEGLTLKLKYFGYLIQRADSLEKMLMLSKTEGTRGDNRG